MHEQNVELVHTSLTTSVDQRVKLHGAWFLILVGLTDFATHFRYTLLGAAECSEALTLPVFIACSFPGFQFSRVQ